MLQRKNTSWVTSWKLVQKQRLLKNLIPFEQKKEREAILKFYEKSVAYLQKKLPLENAVLAKAACLHTDNMPD